MSNVHRLTAAHRAAMAAHRKAVRAARREALANHSQGADMLAVEDAQALAEGLGGDNG
jgi:hypothetical protein